MPGVLTSKKSQPDDATKAGMRFLAQTDLYSLAKVLLHGERPAAENYLTDTFHRPLCDFVQTTPYAINLFLIQRGGLKTSLLTVARNVQRILKNPQIRILVASNKSDNADAMLAEIKNHLLNPILLWLFPEVLWPDPERQAEKWTTSQVTVKVKRRKGAATVETIGMEGEITSKHYEHLTFDDLVGEKNSQTREQVLATVDWWKKSQGLAMPHSTQDIIGCLPGDSEVLLEDGTSKTIASLKPGERVWATDTDGSLVARDVCGVVDQGYASTLAITTRGKVLRATANHPFLVHRHGRLNWCRADELHVGDYVISMKEIPGVLDHPWMTEDFCWLFGFILGDGWVSIYQRQNPDWQGRGHVGIAVSKDEALNAKVQELAEGWLRGQWYRMPNGYIRTDHASAACFLQALGLVGTARTKRLPEWVFRLPPKHRRALLKGFCQADGTKLARMTDAWRVEITNRALMEDLRRLAMLCGVRTGHMALRVRHHRAPHSPKPTANETASSSFNFSPSGRGELHHLAHSLNASPGLRQEMVQAIEPSQWENVFDLTVEGTPSFFANGLAVHNTPWHPNDLYLYLQERKAKEEMPLGVYKVPCWLPDDEAGVEVAGHGKVRATLPEMWPIPKLLEVRRVQGSAIFAAQRLLDPIDDETAVFPRKQAVIRSRDKCPPLEELWCAMTIDPAISTKAWADYSALAVCGFDRSGIMHVLDLRHGKWSEGKLVDEIYDAYGKTPGIRAVGFEAIAFAKIYRREFTRAGEQRGTFLPITTLERDTRTTKNVRIRALSPFWEHGEIILYDDLLALEDFLDEAQRFRLYREATHDDMLDCLADQMQLRARPSEREKRPEWLLDDPVLLERQDAEMAIIEQRRAAGLGPLDATGLKVARNMFLYRKRMDEEREAEILGVGADEFYR